MSKTFKSKTKSKSRERRYEKVNSEGHVIEVIEETVPGGVEAYGNMLIRIENEMKEAAKNMDFERAMELRDILFELKSE